MPVATMSYNQQQQQHDLHQPHASTGSLRSRSATASSKSSHSPSTPTSDYQHQAYPNLPPPAREFLINVEMWVPCTVKSSKLKSKTRSRPSSTIFSPSSSSSRANVSSGSGAASHDDLSLSLAHSVSSPTATSHKTSSIFSSSTTTADPSTTGATDAGTWKPAVCKLSGEGGASSSTAPTGSALLTIYSSDDNTLQHVINIHKLTSTDVRPCDKSLFNRTDVLSLWGHPAAVSLSTTHSHSSVSLTPSAVPSLMSAAAYAPIYLAFSSQEAHNTWLVLLRSYTSPEVYGRLIHPDQGGLYRMWRQVELVVVQTRGVDPNPAAAAASVAKREGAARETTSREGRKSMLGGGNASAGGESRPGTATLENPLALTNSHTPSVGMSGATGSSTTVSSSQAGTSAAGNSPTTPTTMTGSMKSWSTSSLPASMDSEVPGGTSNHSHGKNREKERKEREKREKEKEKREKEKEKERKEKEKKEMKKLAAHAKHGFFAEVVLDGEVCGRTSVKRAVPGKAPSPEALPSPEWFENFLFGDLPSFGNLLVMLWRAPEKYKEKEERPRSSKGVNNESTTVVGGGAGGGGAGSSMSVGATSSIGTGTTAYSLLNPQSSPSGVTAFGGAKGAVFLGCVEIALPNFRRGEWVEGWWPVYHHANSMSGTAGQTSPGHGASSFSGLGMGAGAMGLGGMSGVGGVAGALVQIGEMKLKIKVDEEIILPSRAYKNVLDALEQRNYLDVLSDLEQKLRIDHSMIAPHIVSLAVARNRLLKDIIQLAEREVSSLSGSTNTLFRGNTVLTKTMELAMAWYGRSFLDASIGPIIRRMIKENVEIEVDPSRLRYAPPSSAKRPSTRDSFRPSTRDSNRPGTAGSMTTVAAEETTLESGTRLLEYWCNELWNQMYIVRMDCPVELRRLFGHIRLMVERKFGGGGDPSAFGMLPRQAISSFVFLRFIVPAILRPHLFGLCPGMPAGGVGRSLTLLAKCTQSLANLNPDAGPKEEYMRGISQCLKQNTVTMIDYLACVSSLPDQFSSSANTSSFLSGPDKHDRLHVIHSLRERLTGAGNTIPTLHKDAIPLLPYALDVPKHLAILSSSVVRNARSGTGVAYGRGAANTEGEAAILAKFSDLCFDVEAQALKSVATLAQGAASAAAFNGARAQRSTSVSSTGPPQQNTLTSVASGSRGVTPTASTPTQTGQGSWPAPIRRPTSSRSITTPTGPPSAGNTASASPVSKLSPAMAIPASPKKRKSARPSTAPSPMTMTHPSREDLSQPRLKSAGPDMSPAGGFRYLPPDQEEKQHLPVPGYQTIHRAESENFVAFHYPSASPRFQTSTEALKERRSSRVPGFLKRPSTSSGPTSSQRPKWGDEHSPHSSSGDELSGSQRRRVIGSAGEAYSSGKREASGSSEPKKKRGFFGWLGGKK